MSNQHRAFRAQVSDISGILEMSGSRKQEACANLKKIEDEIGRKGVSQLMVCNGKYPEDFKKAKAFCQTCAAAGNITRPCLPSTPLLFQDQQDGDRKLVKLSGNKLSITPIGTADRYLIDFCQ